MARSEPSRRGHDHPPEPVHLRVLGLGLVITFCMALACLWLWGPLSAASAGIACALTLRGLSRGAAGMLATLVATVAAVLLARPVGLAIEERVSDLTGFTGLRNRAACVVMAFGAMAVGGSVLLGMVARRVVRGSALTRRIDPWLGAAAGLAEGLLLAAGVFWVPLALEPLARSSRTYLEEWSRGGGGDAGQEADDGAPRPIAARPSLGARWVLEAAEEARRSPFGRAARATNPLAGSAVIDLAEEFSRLARDPEAMERFLQSRAVREIADLPSVRRALEMAREDPALRGLAESGRWDRATVLALGDSPVVVRILDETSVLADIEPRSGALREALREAARGTPGPQ